MPTMLCRFEFSTSFPATGEAEDSKYLTSAHHHHQDKGSEKM